MKKNKKQKLEGFRYTVHTKDNHHFCCDRLNIETNRIFYLDKTIHIPVENVSYYEFFKE